MEQFEYLALPTYLFTGLQSCNRYVDDTFVVLYSDHNDNFFRHINADEPNIQFAQVNISDNRLSYSDLLVTIDTDRTLSVAVFRKDTHTDQYLNFQSNQSLHQKLGLAKTLFHWADSLVSKPDNMLAEQKHLRPCLNLRGNKK